MKEKLKYIPPNLLTAVRPILGGVAVHETLQHRPLAALAYLALAQATDMDGAVARRLGAESRFGSFFDPAADGVLRAETAVALAAVISPILGVTAVAAEADVLWQNKQRNNPPEDIDPIIPKGAKWGTAAQSIGASLTLLGKGLEKPVVTFVGGALVATSSIARSRSYRKHLPPKNEQ